MSTCEYPCGHSEVEVGCGGCDPNAIEFVILDGGTVRAFDPSLDMNGPDDE